METVVTAGMGQLMQLGAVVVVLLLVILGLCWFCRALLTDAKEERALTRDALIDNTKVISELKEIIRGALHSR